MTSIPTLTANRAVDLRDIDAVGFDLDHTLALYDDAAVNALAMAEAQELLVANRGYLRHHVSTTPDLLDAGAARALAIDLVTAHIVKLDADRRVRIARRAGIWLPTGEVERAHPEPLPDRRDIAHPLSSPFDVPTLWLFEAVAAAHARESTARSTFDPPRACLDVRQMLDWSHTRGELKRNLVGDLARFVSPVAAATKRLSEWRRAGKKLFVVTNSDASFASAVLDRVIGPDWRTLFVAVSTSSGKPTFFDRSLAGTKAAAISTRAPGEAMLLEDAHADAVEEILAVRGARILYAGDNARADVCAARAYGWKTVHVVAELSEAVAPGDRWGSPFAAGDQPSWFARVVGESADLVCDRIDALLCREPDSRFQPGDPTPSGKTA